VQLSKSLKTYLEICLQIISNLPSRSSLKVRCKKRREEIEKKKKEKKKAVLQVHLTSSVPPLFSCRLSPHE
jgi:hypothetical protein